MNCEQFHQFDTNLGFQGCPDKHFLGMDLQSLASSEEKKILEVASFADSTFEVTPAPDSEIGRNDLRDTAGVCESSGARGSSASINEEFVCSFCGSTCESASGLMVHSALHSGGQSCNICNVSFLTENLLKMHLISHVGRETFECKVCGKAFGKLCDLREHSVVHSWRQVITSDTTEEYSGKDGSSENVSQSPSESNTHACGISKETFGTENGFDDVRQIRCENESGSLPQNNRFKCAICSKSFCKSSDARQHMLAHCDESFLKCKLCDKYCANMKSLQKHVMIHFGESPYECKVCGKRFLTSSYLRLHSEKHSVREPYQCGICKKKLSTKGTLNRHMTCHLKSLEFVCEMCGKSFPSRIHLHNHKVTHGEKHIVCEVCGKLFLRDYNLKKHMMVHTGERPHQCHLCGKAFAESGNLKTHLRVHAGVKPHGCLVCSKRFTTTTELKIHLRTHTGERPYECKYCSLKFKTSSRLCVHIRCHTGERPYACKHCSKSFKVASDLTRHVLTHTGERPYMCGVCGLGFVRNTQLRVHMKVNRNNILSVN